LRLLLRGQLATVGGAVGAHLVVHARLVLLQMRGFAPRSNVRP
jgi:hypothetical protein